MEKKYKDNLEIGSIYLNKYKIIKTLGEGGMNSVVYFAENINYSDSEPTEKFKYVALKVIYRTPDTTDSDWTKILDERVTIGRLMDNPYIVSLELYFPTSAQKDKIIFSMEYVNGPSLTKLIKNRGSLSIVEALSIFKKIILGVNYMHNRERTIIHRDLKPENILLSKDLLDVKISDFGVASVVQNIDGNNYNVLSNETNVFGTIPYISPDVLSKTLRKKISTQLDFHALGIIFYEMLVGYKPFEIYDETDPQIITYFSNFDITPMKKINSKFVNDIENIFLRLTASKDSDKKFRYNNCFEILDDIRKVENVILNKREESKLLVPLNKRNYQSIELFQIQPKDGILSDLKAKPILWFIISFAFLFAILLTTTLIFF